MLPEILGTERQVVWAEKIRAAAMVARMFDPLTMSKLESINDATWWIGNRLALEAGRFKEPAPYQLVGGPPKVATEPYATHGGHLSEESTNLDRPLNAPTSNTTSAKLDAFAESVAHRPALAKALILALFAKVYSGETSRLLLDAAKALVDPDAEQARLAKDIRGVERVIEGIKTGQFPKTK